MTTVRSPALNTTASPGTQGGKEAARSNAILHRIIVEAVAEVAPSVGRDLISLVTTRQGVDDLLKLDDVIDLVRPVASSVPNRGGWHMLVLACWPGCARWWCSCRIQDEVKRLHQQALTASQACTQAG